MNTRGVIIGKIIDDLAILMASVKLRNKANLYDLTKVSEDFFKELLNLIYDFNLVNLNQSRSNEPGLDLGDKYKGIAYQVTSSRSSTKVNQTLHKITDSHKTQYSEFRVLIIGKKQDSYSIKEEYLVDIDFNWKKDIVDVNDIIRDLVVLDIDRLELIFTLFKHSFQQLVIELEPMDHEGNFKSSLYNYIESIPNSPPKNVNRIDKYYGEKYLDKIVGLYHKLASIPKNQREYICLVAERGKLVKYGLVDCYEIHCTKLASILNIDEQQLFRLMVYLEEEKVIAFSHEVDDYERPSPRYYIPSDILNILIVFLKKNRISLRRTIVAMDFTCLEGMEGDLVEVTSVI